MPLSTCIIQRNADGSYSITASLELLAKIQRYESLPPSWRKRIDRMIETAAAEVAERPENVVSLRPRRHHPASM